MVILKYLGCYFAILLILELFFILLAWAFTCVKSFHRAGIRMLCETHFGFMIAPFLCRCKCDGSCGNWTCPKFKRTPGKFEVTAK